MAVWTDEFLCHKIKMPCPVGHGIFVHLQRWLWLKIHFRVGKQSVGIGKGKKDAKNSCNMKKGVDKGADDQYNNLCCSDD